MSFRKFGGLNYNAKNNIVRNRYGVSDNFQSTETIGQNNSKIVSLSDIDMSQNSIMNVNELYFYGNETPQTQPFLSSDISGVFAPIINPSDGINNYAPLLNPDFSGNPTAPTQDTLNISTRLATTAFVKNFFTDFSGTYAPLINPSDGIHNYAPLTNAKFVTGISVSGDVSANSFNNIPIGYGRVDISSNIYNIAIGNNSLIYNTIGINNVALGYYALSVNKSGTDNTAIGRNALFKNTTGNNNTSIGYQSLYNNADGSNNTALGWQSLAGNETGNNNTAIGFQALGNNGQTSTNNTAIGYKSDVSGTSISYSTAIGYNSKATASNQIMLGTSSENVYCPGGIYITQYAQAEGFTATTGNIITNAGNITAPMGTMSATKFTTTSDYRIKENVENIDINEYNIDKLRPVTYINKLTNMKDFGLIAHEIQSEFPSLVSGEKNGEINQSVNYMGLIAILIKEIQELKDEVKLLKQVLL